MYFLALKFANKKVCQFSRTNTLRAIKKSEKLTISIQSYKTLRNIQASFV